MKLTNGLVAFEFDPETGSLIQITDLRPGAPPPVLSDPQEGRLFRLFIPDDEQWIDRCTDSHTSGRPQMRLDGDTLTIHYPDLLAADSAIPGNDVPTGIRASVRVALPAGADEALFTLDLENHSPYTICEALFPWIGGWRGYHEAARGVIYCGAHAPLDPFQNLRRNDGWNILNYTRRVTFGFPHVNIPMADITNGQRGLSYNFYPERPDLNFDLLVIDLNEVIGDPHPSFAWTHRPFLAPGETWRSGRVGVAPHQGDWHVAADKMRNWLETWWRAPQVPASLRGSIGFHNAYFREFSGRHLRSFSSMPAIARFGLEHGLSHFIAWDMSLLGLYLRAGSGGLFEDTPARLAELKQALQEVRALGVHVSPLINMRLGMQAHPFWREHGEQWAIRSHYGLPAQETLPLRAHSAALINRYLDQGGIRFCQGHPEFQEWALANTRHVLGLGFDAIFIDQPFSEDYCFSPHHGHSVPLAGQAGVCNWLPRAVDLVHRASPDGYVIGEVPDIWNTQFCDLWWFWDWSWQRPEIFRYILPASLQSWVIDACDHQEQVSKAFALGFLLNINVHSLEKTILDAPDLAQRVKQLAALRQKTQHYTTAAGVFSPGRFLDQAGLTIDSDTEISAALYQTDTHLGIVLGENNKNHRRGTDRSSALRITLDPQTLGDDASARLAGAAVYLHRQNGDSQMLPLAGAENTKAANLSGKDHLVIETTLEHWECAVIEIKLASPQG